MTTTTRGYGWTHQKLRAALLAALIPGSPCPRCHQPMWPGAQLLDLGHLDGDKTRYAGLEHSRCNRQAGGREGHRRRRAMAQPRPTSRRW